MSDKQKAGALSIPVEGMALPEIPGMPLMGFDINGEIFHVLGFDFGDAGGAIGIWKEGTNFCARLSLESLAAFWKEADEKQRKAPAVDSEGGHAD